MSVTHPNATLGTDKSSGWLWEKNELSQLDDIGQDRKSPWWHLVLVINHPDEIRPGVILPGWHRVQILCYLNEKWLILIQDLLVFTMQIPLWLRHALYLKWTQALNKMAAILEMIFSYSFFKENPRLLPQVPLTSFPIGYQWQCDSIKPGYYLVNWERFVLFNQYY